MKRKLLVALILLIGLLAAFAALYQFLYCDPYTLFTTCLGG